MVCFRPFYILENAVKIIDGEKQDVPHGTAQVTNKKSDLECILELAKREPNAVGAAYFPKNLLKTSILKTHGEVTIGMDVASAIKIASGEFSGVFYMFNYEEFDKIRKELNTAPVN